MKFTVPIATLLLAAISASARVCDEADPLFQWDAIVVGAGMSGSIIAAKIATKNPEKCVLVLEGGKHSGQVEDPISADAVSNSNGNFFDEWKNVSSFKNETHVNTPGTYGEKLVCWDRKCDYLWGEDKSRTPPGLIVGKLVGGSGAINGALMQYPPDYMWDAYPDGWKAEDMKEYLDEIERTMKPTVSFHAQCSCLFSVIFLELMNGPFPNRQPQALMEFITTIILEQIKSGRLWKQWDTSFLTLLLITNPPEVQWAFPGLL